MPFLLAQPALDGFPALVAGPGALFGGVGYRHRSLTGSWASRQHLWSWVQGLSLMSFMVIATGFPRSGVLPLKA